MWLEEDFHRQLSDAGTPRLSRPKSAEGVAVELIEGTDLVGAIHSARADAFGSEVRVVQDVEVLDPELQSPGFGNGDVLGQLHAPVDRGRQTKNILADITKRAERGRPWGKRSGIEPANAVYRRTA